MTSREFTIWLHGFMEACNDFTATPKQWDRIKEELSKVDLSFNEKKPFAYNTKVWSDSKGNWSYDKGWAYDNGENKKQQLND